MEPHLVQAVVRLWHDEEGWGVLDSPATPGGCWTHCSALDMDGHATARAGQSARLIAEQAQQDGFGWRAVKVVLDGVPPRTHPVIATSEPTSAYRSHLSITFD